MLLRNLIEYAALIAIWYAQWLLVQSGAASSAVLIAIVLVIAWVKTAFFGAENLRQLMEASAKNWPYHRFMLLMLVNMSQIILSFTFDFHLLESINFASFAVVQEGLSAAELIFEFFYFSALNFMFFGYGDITPQSIPAKLLVLTEITLAFVTVIFLLSDFISLKESLRWERKGHD